MEQNYNEQLQLKLEKYIADINPMRSIVGPIGSDREYKHEVEQFLEQAQASMHEEELISLLRVIFRRMFNLTEDESYLAMYKKIVKEYLRLVDV